MLEKVSVQNAVGTRLAHDITEIRPGEFKGPAFRKGHTVCDGDICHLQKLGKNHLYLLNMEEGEIHENQAAKILAKGLAGQGIEWNDDPKEGKITLHAAYDGILSINIASLAAFNLIDEVMCATQHNNTLVKKGDLVAATRAIPLVMKQAPIERAALIGAHDKGIVSVKPLKNLKTGLVITGSEVYNGLIEDGFAPVLSKKINDLGSRILSVKYAPDDSNHIQQAILNCLDSGCDLIILSGGMSVDPDDVTRTGIQQAGATEMYYGSAVLPGAMFLVAYINDIPLLGVPACGLFHRITVLDLILPRVMAGEHIDKKELAFLGHGGLCMNCKKCTFPHCPFGKGV
ncbi:molybdopterin-binding protein [Desulfobacula phenolica]|uniref:Molybdopterin molybdenumtransferase n=1 Tax=Desulfobacula phenolica TaxID=90732 RepID=A0A1H2J4D2_9BACT|nr:molybdopterin-binding protein [Desulfobacula phenolica]SDU51006.1 Probable molybdopterin binding domain-containing protein [Desulfobacula phenolica]